MKSSVKNPLVVSLLFFSIFPFLAEATSFDCSKATTKIEKMICSEEDLSVQDSRLADLYKEVMGIVKDKEVLKKDQRGWLRERNACEAKACVEESYKKRIRQLEDIVRLTNRPAPSSKSPQKMSPEERERRIAELEEKLVTPGAEHYRGHYKLIRDGIKKDCGSDVEFCKKINSEMCTELEKSLNSFPDKPPMVCERYFNKDLGFTTPNWQPVPEEKIDWEALKNVFYFQARRSYKAEDMEFHWSKYERELKSLLNEEKPFLWEAKFDVDNNGEIEHVFMNNSRDYSCTVDRYYGNGYGGPNNFILDSGGKKFDESYEALGARGLFQYKGKTYSIRWNQHDGVGHDMYGDLQIDILFKPRQLFGWSNERGCSFKFIVDQ